MKKIFEFIANEEYEKAEKYVLSVSPNVLNDFFHHGEQADLIEFCKAASPKVLKKCILDVKDRQTFIFNTINDEQTEELLKLFTPEEKTKLLFELPQDIAFHIACADDLFYLLNTKQYALLKKLLPVFLPVDLAKIFETSDKNAELLLLFRLLPKDLATKTFVEISSKRQEELLNQFTNIELKEVVDRLFLDDFADLLEEMPASLVKKLLSIAGKEKRDSVNKILMYPQNSAGSIMTVEFISFKKDWTVLQAITHIKNCGIDKETIYNGYVTDGTRKLIGLVTTKDLLLANEEATIEDIMKKSVVYVHTYDDREYVANTISDYGFLAIPVVDAERRLVGIVTVDDAIEVLQAETTEDISKISAIIPTDTPYLKTSVFSIWKNRIPWLLILMISATLTGLIINTFEGRLNLISPLLFACVPMLMDTGGNSGSQASVTIIRSLALGDLSTKDVFKVLWKEFRVSILLGLTLSLACFAKLLLIDNLLFGYAYTVQLSAIVSIALLATVIIAKIVGGLLPLLAKVCRLDPAVVASPFITTIVDALSLMIYCMLALSLLG